MPSGSTIDATEAVTQVVERFAPGFREIVVAARAVPAARMADHNANYVGGDIGMGGNSAWRAIAGPTPRLNPWRTPIPKAYPVLGGHPARRRRARHGRLLRRAYLAQARVRDHRNAITGA